MCFWEKAAEKYPDWTGNEVMWLHYGLEYKYDLNFDMSTGYLNKFAVLGMAVEDVACAIALYEEAMQG